MTDYAAHMGCPYCGDRLLPRENDHIVPLSRGGSNNPDNIQEVCIACNRQKGAMLLYEWKSWRLSNGMPWPPLASHATDPVHYKNRTCLCPESHTPDRLLEVDGGYRAIYTSCPEEGPYRVWWGLIDDHISIYDDCECTFCRHMSRLWKSEPIEP